jgi:hypothetical protein
MAVMNPYSSAAVTGPTFVNRKGKTKPMKPKQIEKAVMLQRYENMQQAYPQLWQSVGNLKYQANANPWEQYASLAAPQFEQANRYYEGAGSNLQRNLSAYGLENSSAAGSAMGALEGAHLGARSSIYGNVMGQVQDDRQAARDRLLSLMYQLSTGEADAAAGIADRRLNRQLQAQAMDPGSLLQQLMPLLGAGLGGWAGSGFK